MQTCYSVQDTFPVQELSTAHWILRHWETANSGQTRATFLSPMWSSLLCDRACRPSMIYLVPSSVLHILTSPVITWPSHLRLIHNQPWYTVCQGTSISHALPDCPCYLSNLVFILVCLPVPILKTICLLSPSALFFLVWQPFHLELSVPGPPVLLSLNNCSSHVLNY